MLASNGLRPDASERLSNTPLETIDQTVADLAAHPFDVAPMPTSKPLDASRPRTARRRIARRPRPTRRAPLGQTLGPFPAALSRPLTPRSRSPLLARSSHRRSGLTSRFPRLFPGRRHRWSPYRRGKTRAARSSQSALPEAAPVVRRADTAARPWRPPVYAGGPAPNRGRKQSVDPPGCLRYRSGQGCPETVRHLSQPDDRFRVGPEQQQHGPPVHKGFSSIR